MGTGGAALVAAALAVVVVTRLWTVLLHLVWRPYAVARAFARQGVRGPPYRVFVGNSKEVQAMRAATSGDTLDLNSHDYIPRVDVALRQGKEVFLAQRELQFIAFASIYNVRVPGMQYVPTKANVRRWQLERTVRGTLMAIIGERLAAAKEARGYGSDLLGLMLEANAAGDDGGKRQQDMSMDEIVDECKTFFVAGHDTTSHLLTWAMFLLGTHPEWQQRLREEVIRECGGAEVLLRGDSLNKLKLVTMVLYETLRLYGTLPMIARQATADSDLCGVKVPKGTLLLIPIAMLHRDEEVWAADAGAFNPLRFRDGMGRAAAHPNALLSFSSGPRSCIGQDFAMLEAKATLALILRRFAFEVAAEYVHAPADFLTLQTSKGLPVVLRLLDPYSWQETCCSPIGVHLQFDDSNCNVLSRSPRGVHLRRRP
ncbi:unnamed protein product [Miscanthus lutarioriparius]|uniref:Cytochrome P450 n=1 Tax=Miscanthus lutarioriparius TaxID=422564 RepID=A0A811SBF4_9POAL|nr:unnamed protein product [Miscanthus lutarioriparius]